MDVELYTDLLKRISEDRGVPNEFAAHHGESIERDPRGKRTPIEKFEGTCNGYLYQHARIRN